MQSTLKKRAVLVGDRRTSISLEDDFWDALNIIAKKRKMPMARLMELIAKERNQSAVLSRASLSSAVRLFILRQYRRK